MKTAMLVGLASAVVGVGIAIAPGDVVAGGRSGPGRVTSGFHGHGFNGHKGHGFNGHGFHHKGHGFQSGFKHHGFNKHHHHHGFNKGFGFGYVAPGVVIYSAPAYQEPVYVPQPVYAAPAYAPSYAPPPMQRVVEYSTGRYELHGDGYSTAYRWVWIPNPPPPPAEVVPEPQAAPPAAPVAREPIRRLDFYRWTDDQGVVHFSDRLDRVPEAYRSQVKKSPS
jgi:hypothetical protein